MNKNESILKNMSQEEKNIYCKEYINENIEKPISELEKEFEKKVESTLPWVLANAGLLVGIFFNQFFEVTLIWSIAVGFAAALILSFPIGYLFGHIFGILEDGMDDSTSDALDKAVDKLFDEDMNAVEGIDEKKLRILKISAWNSGHKYIIKATFINSAIKVSAAILVIALIAPNLDKIGSTISNKLKAECRVDKVNVKPNVFLINDNTDAGFSVISKVINLGARQNITVTTYLSTSEGDFVKETKRIFSEGEEQLVTLGFPEPTINAQNIQARTSCN